MSPEKPENQANIADVGVGVSQSLPVLSALHAAMPGQLVYVEQPETHLHPRAQFALAHIAASEKDEATMEKDAFLLEAAQATADRKVVSLDENARG